MSIGLQVWSTTASNNSTSDTNINFPEGMSPSQVDDSARALMASMAKWRDDNNSTIVTGGTTTAFTVTSNQVSTGLTAGYTIAVQFNATADTSATLNVDALGAKPMQIVSGTNLQGGEFTAGDCCRFTYSSSGTGQWIAQGPQAYIQNGAQLASSTVSFSKLQNFPASSVLGNISTSSSTGAAITIGAGALFQVPVVSVFTSTGSGTWNTTTSNGLFPIYLRVRMVGGGGGGGAATTNNGSSGTDSSFISWTAIGAKGGALGTGGGGTGGSGGVNGTGTLITRVSGAAGQGGFGIGSTANPAGAAGGGSPFGGAGSGTANSTGGAASANTGSGGAGGGNSNNNSGSGGGAGEFVEFIVTSPTTTAAIVVGGGGAGGAAGVQAGGAGAAGRVEVIAYWQ